MEFKIHQGVLGNIAELSADAKLKNIEDFVDLIGNVSYHDMDKIIISEENLLPDFFDLKTKIAGDILQKFSTYNLRLAIIGNFSNLKSKSLNDFIRESNRTGRILFVNGLSTAISRFNTK